MRTSPRTLCTVLALSLGPLAAVSTGSAQRRVSDVPYVPTPPEVVEEMLALARPDSGDTVYDLGSGDGRIVIAAAQRYGARGVGIEIEPGLVRLADERARSAGVAGRVSFVRGDLFEADLRPATVVTLYLLASLNLKLRPLLLEQLRPGTRVVSHTFAMGEWEPDSVVVVGRDGRPGPKVHAWVIPARVEGTWDVDPGEGERFVLELRQEFQKVRGTVRVGGRAYPLDDASLRGDRITFSFREAVDGGVRVRRFTGRVAGDSIRGTGPDGGEVAWRARRVSRQGSGEAREEGTSEPARGYGELPM